MIKTYLDNKFFTGLFCRRGKNFLPRAEFFTCLANATIQTFFVPTLFPKLICHSFLSDSRQLQRVNFWQRLHHDLIHTPNISVRQALKQSPLEDSNGEDISYNDDGCQNEEEIADFYSWVHLGPIETEYAVHYDGKSQNDVFSCICCPWLYCPSVYRFFCKCCWGRKKKRGKSQNYLQVIKSNKARKDVSRLACHPSSQCPNKDKPSQCDTTELQMRVIPAF